MSNIIKLDRERNNRKMTLPKDKKKISCLVINGPAAGGVYDADFEELSFQFNQTKHGRIDLPRPVAVIYDAHILKGDKKIFRVFATHGTDGDQVIADLLKLAFHGGRLPAEDSEQ
jgi:hypothetical protein